MKEYKMRRGEYLEDRVEDMRSLIEEYFGTVEGTAAMNGIEMFEVADPDNPVFDRILAGTSPYGSKKDQLAVHFEERPAEEVIAAGEADAAAEAVDLKNDFLLEVTGRDAKSRRESMKRSVEDSDDVPEDV